MSKFKERLAAAKAAPKPFRDVTITLDADIAEKRAVLKEELEAARAEAANDQRLTAVNPREAEIQGKLDELYELTEDSLITLRFTRLPGDQWAEVTARCPVRLDAPIDSVYGYDMHKAARLAAPLCGVLVEGDELVPLRVEKATGEHEGIDEWRDLFATIAGVEYIAIIDALYDLNVYEPSNRVDQLKKELATRPA